MSEEQTPPSLSEEDEEEGGDACTQPQLVELQGYLSKWTNYLHGWQERWVVLKNGTLSYYKSEFDTAYGCRGSMSLAKSTIQAHDFDECRFDVSVNDCMYYLRTSDTSSRQKWVDALEAVKAAESGYGSESSLRKVGSMLSLSSVTSLSTTASTSSFKNGRGLREKLMELETFRDIVCRQVDTLQGYFDACAEFSDKKTGRSLNGEHPDDIFGSTDGLDHDADDEMDELSSTPTPATMTDILTKRPSTENTDNVAAMSALAAAKGIDFKGEAFTFKATTVGILATLAHCIELISKREEYFQRRLDKEIERRKKAETAMKETVSTARKQAFMGGPDFEEGPHSALNEEEFYDAMEISLDRNDEQECEQGVIRTRFDSEILPSPPTTAEPKHRLTDEVNQKVDELLLLIKEDVDNNWYNVHEDGDMKVYRRDYEEGGVVLDPMKATHIVKGVTGRELAHYFFDKDVRMDWETSVEYFRILDDLSQNTVIFHQVYKRVWPSSQRDMVFVSNIRDISPSREMPRDDKQIGHSWLVSNYSVEHPDAPVNKYVRASVSVALFCQTLLLEPGEKLTRENIACKMTYSAIVNPGGWAPPSVVRAVSKREYPKFLRKISIFCKDAFKDKAITL